MCELKTTEACSYHCAPLLQCLSLLWTQLRTQVDKNVVMLEKRKDGTIAKHVQASPEDCIKLGAMLPPVDLTTAYGVSASLAATMDSAAKAAVAAGLEVTVHM